MGKIDKLPLFAYTEIKVQLRNVKRLTGIFLLDGKVAKAHERNFHACTFE